MYFCDVHLFPLFYKYQELVHLNKCCDMAKNTSILLGDHFEEFISSQIESGRFASASEVVRAALRLFEQEENQKKELIKELKRGEASGFVKNADRKKFIKDLHNRHLANGL